jgi:hypothetical protein
MTARRKLTEAGTGWAGARYEAPFDREGPTYAHDLARWRNAQINRPDIEWAVNPDSGQIYLRDRLDWAARRTGEIEHRLELDRQRWIKAQRRAGALGHGD